MTVTPVFCDGAEHGATATTNGGGVANTVGAAGATPTPTSSIAAPDSGAYSWRHNVTVAGTSYIRKTLWTTGDNNVCGTFKFKVDTDLSATAFLAFIGAAAGSGGGVRWVASTKVIQAYTTAGTVNGSTTLSLNTWYRVAWRFDCSGGTTTMYIVLYDMDDNQLDSISRDITQTATNATYFQWGWSTSVTGDAYFDDIVCSTTGTEHPLPALAVLCLKPASDGTHNAGTNVMEDNAGTDIGTTTAYDKINSVPPSSATYIQQAAGGTGNYVEVNFADLSVGVSAVYAARAILAYTSATTTANRGACMVSKDAFSSFTTVWGNDTTTADYSDGATNNLFFKSAMISGVTSDTLANALTARMGYSGDASPIPYWIDLVVEVVCVPSTSVALTIANSSHSHTAGNLALTQHNVLAVGNSSHAQTSGNLALTQHNILAVADSAHAHTAGNLALVQHSALTVANSSHDQTSGNLALTQHNILAVQDADHAHAADNVVLVGEGAPVLDIANMAHAHTSANLGLTQHNALAVQTSAHGHASGVLPLTQHNVLAVQNSSHDQTSGELTLTYLLTLIIQNSHHGHYSPHVGWLDGVGSNYANRFVLFFTHHPRRR